MKKVKYKKKSLRAAIKRFSITGNKKILHRKAGKSHLLAKKSPKRKRYLARNVIINKSNKAQIQKLLPYIK